MISCIVATEPLFRTPELNRLHTGVGGLVPSHLVADANGFSTIEEELLAFLQCLFLPPQDLPYFNYLDRHALFLLTHLARMHTLGNAFQSTLVDTAHSLFRRRFPRPKSVSSRSLQIDNYPVYALHLAGLDPTDRTLRQAYCRYGLLSHVTLASRIASAQQSTRTRKVSSDLYLLGLALRVFLRACPHDPSAADTPTLDPPSEEILHQTMKRYVAGTKLGMFSREPKLFPFLVGWAQSETTADNYYQVLARAFGYRDPRSRRPGPISDIAPESTAAPVGLSTRQTPRPAPAGCPTHALGGWEDDDDESRELDYDAETESLIIEGEAPAEHAEVRQTRRPPARSFQHQLQRRIYRQYRARLAALYRQRVFWFERRIDPISVPATVLQLALEEAAAPNAPLAASARLAYLAVLLSTGIDAERLAQLAWAPDHFKVKDPDCTSDRLVLDRDSNSLAYPMDPETCGWYRSASTPWVPCRPTSPWIILPITSFAASCMHRYFAYWDAMPDDPLVADRVFLFQEGKETRPLHTADVEAWLATRMSSPWSGRKKLGAVVRSVRVHALQQCGLDPVLATYLYTTVPFRVSSQRFYTHIPRERLSTACIQTGERLLGLYRDDLSRDRRESSEVLLLPSGIPTQPQGEPPHWWAGTGSRCVMTTDAVRTLAVTLRQEAEAFRENLRTRGHFAPDAMRILLFNLVMINNYLLYQFGTGLRPLSDCPITSRNVRWSERDRSHVVLGDKFNRRFQERRIVPHARTVSEALRLSREATDRIQRHFAPPRYVNHNLGRWRKSKDAPYFFLLDPDGKPEDCSREHIQFWLLSICGSLSEQYRVPANAPRHFLRTWLSEAAFPYTDIFLGHVHEADEFLGLYSAAHAPGAEGAFLRHIDAMLDEIQFRPLAYEID